MAVERALLHCQQVLYELDGIAYHKRKKQLFFIIVVWFNTIIILYLSDLRHNQTWRETWSDHILFQHFKKRQNLDKNWKDCLPKPKVSALKGLIRNQQAIANNNNVEYLHFVRVIYVT